jgi:hypothetical protein
MNLTCDSLARFRASSCRKPHGDSVDALLILDDLLQASVADSSIERPQQLLLTGDQIYADDVADSLHVMIRETANLLIGAPPFDGGPAIDPSAAGAGTRQAYAESVGLTSEEPFQKSHPFTFAEYCAMYLLTWSDAICAGTQPTPQLSTFEQVYGRSPMYGNADRQFLSAEGKEFNRENEALISFYRALPRARR